MRHPDIKGSTWPCSRLMWFDPLDFSSDGENDIPLTIEDGFAFWRPPTTLYSIIYERFDTWDAAYKAFRAISEQMKRLCQKKPDVACLVGLSRIQGRGAVRGRIQNGKQGAAEISVKGQEVAPHIHLVIMASNTATICKAITSKYNKKRGFTAAKSRILEHEWRQQGKKGNLGLADLFKSMKMSRFLARKHRVSVEKVRLWGYIILI